MSSGKRMILPAQAGAECYIGGMSQITLKPIGYVRNEIREPKEDYWGDVPSVIEMDAEQFAPDALRGLDDFSHVEVVFHLSGVEDQFVVTGARHPRDNPDWPLTGIFAQRGKARPNRIAATICRVIKVSKLEVVVADLDALDGTPVLDIKPVLAEFLPDKRDVRQPSWSHELMENYFLSDREDGK
jgi:tRNA (Thr-GGU) A37 N-methylase